MAWRDNKTEENASALLQALTPVINTSLRLYASNMARSPTLRSKAKILILDKLDRFNEKEGSILTFVQSELRRLYRLAGKERQVISLPEVVAKDYNTVSQARQYLRAQLGRDPSIGELSDFTGLSMKRINYVNSVSAPQSASAWTTRFIDDFGLTDVFGRRPDKTEAEAAMEAVYTYLAPIDQYIIENYYGLFGKPQKKLNEIATDLNLPKSEVVNRLGKLNVEINKGLY